MKRALYALMGLVVAALLFVLVAPLLISAEDARNSLFAQVENATGYRIRVSGPVSVSMFPSLGLTAGNVSVSQKTGDRYEEFATAGELRFGLALSALFGGTVRMTELALVEPVIRVPTPAEADDTAAGKAGNGAKSSPGAALRNLALDQLIIEDGTLIIPASDMTVHALNLTSSLPAYDAALSLEMSAVVDNQPVAVAGTIGGFGPFLDGSAAPVDLTVSAPAVLTREIALAGTLLYTGDRFSLDEFTAKAGDSAFGGSVSGDLSGDVPVISAKIDGESLDLDALLPKQASGKSAGEKTGDKTGDKTARAGDAEIDFSPLSSVAANIELSLSNLTVSGNTVAPVVANATVGGGKADIVADLIGIGGATGSGSVGVDATRDPPYISGKLKIGGVDLSSAGALAGQDLPVSGAASADIVFATAGRTVEELRTRLNASGSLSLADGAAMVPQLAEAIGDKAAGTVSGIDVTARFEDLLKPVSVAGNASWRGERFDLSATADVRGILAGNRSPVEARAASSRVSAGFSGNVSSDAAGSGRVSLETASLIGLMRWLGREPGWQSGFEAFSVEGDLTVTDTAITFKDTAIRLDNTRGTGNGMVTLGAKPSITARLELATLDINPYLGAGGGRPSGQTAPTAATAEWSEAPIDFSALNALNADLKLTVGELLYKDIKAGPVGIAATIDAGHLNAELEDLRLYGGSGAGSLGIDASGRVPSQIFSFSLDDLDALPFLRDAAGFSRIEGTGAIAVDLAGSGASQRAIVSSLTGSASFSFTDGAVRGINVAKMARSLTSGTLTGWQSSAEEKTDFASLGATFDVTDGNATTGDLHLTGPLVRVKGSGTVNMPAQTLNIRVDPKVVASLEGQGSDKELEGLGVPVVIAGPWGKPNIYPDIAGILQNPQAAYEQLRNLGGGLFNLPDAGGLIGGLTGGGTGEPGSSGLDQAVSGVDQQIKEKTGLSISDLLQGGKVDEETLQKGVATGLAALLGASGQGGAPADQPAAQGQPQAALPAAPVAPDTTAAASSDDDIITGAIPIPIPRPDPRRVSETLQELPAEPVKLTPEAPKAETPAEATPTKGGKKSKNAKADESEQTAPAANAPAQPQEELQVEDVAKSLLQGLFGGKQ